MTQAFLSIRNVEKYFSAVKAVDDVSLDIRENEFFALLGASGSGKTTLLRMLAGFESLSGGDILIEGSSIANMQPNQRPVNLMFQSYALFPHMTVAQNIAYGLEMEKLPKAEITERVNAILDVIQLSHLAKRKPDQLSGGQRQRVALARALVKRPKVLLLDEPLGALDKKLRSEMQLELKRLQHEFGITFIMVTHDQEEALVMADRIAIMRDGALLQVGSPKDIYELPGSRYAADFIGVMNFLKVKRTDNGFAAPDGTAIATAHVSDGVGEGDAIAAVRPERLFLGDAGDNHFDGTVSDIAYHGLDLLLHVETELSDTPVVARMTADVADNHRPEIGQRITLGWLARDTHIFPA
ncbi:ABC transporter ATP-binding protein [Oricola nitratireducens]|uniref:ABC transporter ATP-binding protein n=1 Tax=Oricola nitratireducens TaxID=2775868 RepID=UPI001866ACD0|nr:ABC transporter ATP-binding protein [Oricola nitratireducens]